MWHDHLYFAHINHLWWCGLICHPVLPVPVNYRVNKKYWVRSLLLRSQSLTAIQIYLISVHSCVLPWITFIRTSSQSSDRANGRDFMVTALSGSTRLGVNSPSARIRDTKSRDNPPAVHCHIASATEEDDWSVCWGSDTDHIWYNCGLGYG